MTASTTETLRCPRTWGVGGWVRNPRRRLLVISAPGPAEEDWRCRATCFRSRGPGTIGAGVDDRPGRPRQACGTAREPGGVTSGARALEGLLLWLQEPSCKTRWTSCFCSGYPGLPSSPRIGGHRGRTFVLHTCANPHAGLLVRSGVLALFKDSDTRPLPTWASGRVHATTSAQHTLPCPPGGWPVVPGSGRGGDWSGCRMQYLHVAQYPSSLHETA